MKITIPPTREDKTKSDIYSKIKAEDIREYTRQCMKSFDEVRHKTLREKLTGKRAHLDEILFELAIKRETAEENEKRKIDLLALKTIKRCCRGSFQFIRHYYRLYRDIKNNNIDFYISDVNPEGDETCFY